MAKATPLDKLGDKIDAILQDYAGEISENLQEATKRVAQAGVTALRQSSRATFKSKDNEYEYAKSWKKKVSVARLSTRAILYNDHPGLPHLLEYGHAQRGGGRVEGRPHIAPVEEMINDQFFRAVEEAIR